MHYTHLREKMIQVYLLNNRMRLNLYLHVLCVLQIGENNFYVLMYTRIRVSFICLWNFFVQWVKNTRSLDKKLKRMNLNMFISMCTIKFSRSTEKKCHVYSES